MRKVLYLSAAGFFFVLGVLGVVLPGLPATPLLLLTSYFLVRSSPGLNAALLRSKVFGPILQDWQEKGGVARHIKYQAIGAVVIAVAVSLYFTADSLWFAAAVAIVAAIGVFVVIRLPEV